jgi:hypothetical protein
MPCNYKDYPPNWKEIRKRILERANNKCENCGVPNNAYIYRYGKNKWDFMPEGHKADVMALDGFKFTKIILTIAHLDHDKRNNEISDDRLRAWCQKCHLSYDLPRHIENRRYGRNFRDNQSTLF